MTSVYIYTYEILLMKMFAELAVCGLECFGLFGGCMYRSVWCVCVCLSLGCVYMEVSVVCVRV